MTNALPASSLADVPRGHRHRFVCSCGATQDPPIERPKLTPTDVAFMAILEEAKGGIVTREEFVRRVWGGYATLRCVDIRVGKLRRILGPHTIETVVQRGYRLGAM